MDLWHDVALEWHAQLNELRYQGLVETPVKKGHSFMKLMPHQQKAVDELHNGAVLVGDVGVGKTITALTYFYTKVCGGVDPATGTMRTPMDLYVITTAKKRDSLDWQGDAASLGISDDREKSIEAIQLTVDSWNNIGKYTEVKDAFFIFDEQRLVGSGHWSKSFIKIAKHNKWVLLSATPGDTWLDYIPVFVANGFYKNRTDFKRQHCVYNTYTKFPKVERYVGVGKLVRHKRAILVEMPYLRHTVRHNETIKVAHDKQLFDKAVKDRWHVFENRPIRDVSELFHVMRKVVNYDVSRVTEIEKLLEKHPKLIVFYNFDYELERLRELRNYSPATTRNGSCSSSSMGLQYMERETSKSFREMEEIGTCDPSRDGHPPTSTETSNERNEECLNILRADGDTTAYPTMVEDGSHSPLRKRNATSVEKSESSSLHHSSLSAQELPSKSSTNGSRISKNGNALETLLRPTTVPATSMERTAECVRSSDVTFEKAGTNGRSMSGKDVAYESAQQNDDVCSGVASILPQTREAGTNDSQSRTTSGRTTTTRSSMRVTRPLIEESEYASMEMTADTPIAPMMGTFEIAEWNGHKHEPIPSSDSWVYLVQYVAGSEGWNCVETDAVCFYSQTYSYKNFHQAHGRIDRLNTPYTDLWYYSLISDSLIDKAIGKALKNKKNFNEKKFGHFG